VTTTIDHMHAIEAVAVLRFLVVEVAVVAVAVQEAIRDQDLHPSAEDHTVEEDVVRLRVVEEVIGVGLEVIVDPAVVHPHIAEVGPTEIEEILVEVTGTNMIEEDLHQDTADEALQMIIEEVEESMTIEEFMMIEEAMVVVETIEEAMMIEVVEMIMDRHEEETTEVTVSLVLIRIMIRTVYKVQGIHMDHEGVDHHHPAVVVAVVANAVDMMKEFLEYHCWFETSVLRLQIKILVWHLDESEMFVMFIYQEITIHSNRKALHLSSMPIPTRPVKHVMRWIVFVSRDVN